MIIYLFPLLLALASNCANANRPFTDEQTVCSKELLKNFSIKADFSKDMSAAINEHFPSVEDCKSLLHFLYITYELYFGKSVSWHRHNNSAKKQFVVFSLLSAKSEMMTGNVGKLTKVFNSTNDDPEERFLMRDQRWIQAFFSALPVDITIFNSSSSCANSVVYSAEPFHSRWFSFLVLFFGGMAGAAVFKVLQKLHCLCFCGRLPGPPILPVTASGPVQK